MDSWLKDNMNMKPFHVGDQLITFICFTSYRSQKRVYLPPVAVPEIIFSGG